VTSIQTTAFYGDTSLATVTMPGHAPTFGSTVFSRAGTIFINGSDATWTAAVATAVLPMTLSAFSDAYSYNTAGGSTAPASSSAADGSSITLASAATKSGYTFSGWNDGTTTYAAGATYTLASAGAAIVFTAQWTVAPSAPQYVMDYFSYSDASLGVVPQNGIGIDNTPITLAAAPVRSGYTFSGWNDGTTTYPGGAKYVLTSAGNPILFSAIWVPATLTTSTVTATVTSPAAPQLTSFVGTKHGLIATFSSSDQTATSFLCRVSNGHDVFVRTATMTPAVGQSSYVCSFGGLEAPHRYRVWVTALNQNGSSAFASTTAVTHR
jgi:hypothetical protein